MSNRSMHVRRLGRAALVCMMGAMLSGATAVGRTFAAVHDAARRPSTREVLGAVGTLLIIDRPLVLGASHPYELAGPLVVVAGGSLTIEAGAHIEARPGASIDVTREARLVARGTLLQPIVMTCTGTPKYEGCWNGLTLRGYGRINHGTPTSPPDRISGASGCLQSNDGELAYGGCADTDSSGVLRYVRVEYAAHGIELLGVGSRTSIDQVQINRSRADGMSISGGAVDVRHLFLTGNVGYGLSWHAGWRGRGQFILVQQDPLNNTGGISGTNDGESPTAFSGTPRSAPTLFNVTIIAPSSTTNPGDAAGPSAMHARRGTGGTVRNVLIHSSATAFDIDDTQTCGGFGDQAPFAMSNVVVAGTTRVGHPDTDPFNCESYGSPTVEAEWLADPANQAVTITDPVLVAKVIQNATNLLLPDLRPGDGAVASTHPAATPPADGFFDQTALFIGAIQPAYAARNNVPWYAGWTAPAPRAPLPGSVYGTLRFGERGPLAGADIVSSFGVSATTDSAGAFVLDLPAGQHQLTVSSVPIGCGAPTQSVVVTSGDRSTRDIDGACTLARAITVGARHACAMTNTNQAQCWGQNDYGMVGDGTTVSPRAMPVHAADNFLFSATTLTSGLTHTCGVQTGTVFCWGVNVFGTLGAGATGSLATTPVGAGTITTPAFTALTAGGYHTCALTAEGEAWCWGWNAEGQLGTDSDAFMIATPTRVSAGLLRFSQITAGDSHTCAIATTGATYCWGGNGRGELGQDTAVGSGRIGLSSRVPVELPTTLRFASIDAGTLHTCGVTVAGTAYCWGSREYGQLGDGIVGGLSIEPVAVGGTEHFLHVSAGSYTTCGVSLAHQVFCWGAGASGVLGNGTVSATQALPNAVSGSLRARAVAVNLADIAGLSACALSDLSEVFCWGAGASGQLGTGQRTASSVPVQVRLLPPE